MLQYHPLEWLKWEKWAMKEPPGCSLSASGSAHWCPGFEDSLTPWPESLWHVMPSQVMYPTEMHVYVHQKTHTKRYSSPVYNDQNMGVSRVASAVEWIHDGVIMQWNAARQWGLAVCSCTYDVDESHKHNNGQKHYEEKGYARNNSFI